MKALFQNVLYRSLLGCKKPQHYCGKLDLVVYIMSCSTTTGMIFFFCHQSLQIALLSYLVKVSQVVKIIPVVKIFRPTKIEKKLLLAMSCLTTKTSNFLRWLLQYFGHIQFKNKGAKSVVNLKKCGSSMPYSASGIERCCHATCGL